MSRLDVFRRWWAIHSIPAEMRVYFALFQGECFALDICQRYQVGYGKLYPILIRAEQEGVVESEWREWVQPRRREYRLTDWARQRTAWVMGQAHRKDDWAKLHALFSEAETP